MNPCRCAAAHTYHHSARMFVVAQPLRIPANRRLAACRHLGDPQTRPHTFGIHVLPPRLEADHPCSTNGSSAPRTIHAPSRASDSRLRNTYPCSASNLLRSVPWGGPPASGAAPLILSCAAYRLTARMAASASSPSNLLSTACGISRASDGSTERRTVMLLSTIEIRSSP